MEKYCDKNEFEFTPELGNKIINVERERLKKLSDVVENVEYYFKTPKVDETMIPWKNCSNEKTAMFLKNSKDIIENISTKDFKIKYIEKKLLKAAGESKGEMLWPLRVALTGQKYSPSPFEIAWVIGKNETINRIEKAIDLMLEKSK